MLEELLVKNLALIEEAQINFGSGLNILTGETGAGKSVLLGSINLCMGKKANKELIKDSSKEAKVELVFSGKEDNTIIKRSISTDKSMSKINGENVTLSELKETSSKFIDIYGQHDSEDLRDDAKHINYIDIFGTKQIKPIKDELQIKLNDYKKAKNKLKDFDLDENVRTREIDLLEYEIKEIVDAELKDNEEEDLEKKYKLYSNSKNILESLSEAKYILEESRLENALSEIKKVKKYDDSIEDISKSLEDATSIIQDCIRDIDKKVSNNEINEEDFYNIEKRLDLIRSITMKYGGSVEKTLTALEEKTNRLNLLKNYEKEKNKVLKEIESKENLLNEVANKLTEVRKKTAKEFEKKLTKELEDLSFLQVKFEIEFNKRKECTLQGYDEVVFMVSLNVGEKLKPLTEVASGGELSRIMLAIKTIIADADDTNTLIFDEIDQGISGITASKVASKLKKISKNRQVICITHLPQIAALADTHFGIIKTVKNNKTITTINKLNDEEQVMEIARLLSNGKITEKAIENARDLKQ